ncbi:MAG TPA: hypothetical protein VMR97_08650 [Acidimicrobiales bacterium]|nr:hypothetical protein [Acidimicrobiales bacterium]
MSEDAYITRELMLEAFRRLAVISHREGIVLDVYLFGGGAMLSAFEERGPTKDLDARYASSGKVQRAIEEVAAQMGFPRWWLNEQGTVYLPRTDHQQRHPVAVFDHPNLRVMRVSDRQLLAMKIAAGRRLGDLEDIALLVSHLELSSVDEALTIHHEFFPEEPLSDAKVSVLEDAVAQVTSQDSRPGAP